MTKCFLNIFKYLNIISIRNTSLQESKLKKVVTIDTHALGIIQTLDYVHKDITQLNDKKSFELIVLIIYSSAKITPFFVYRGI